MTATMTDTTRRSKKLYKDPNDKMIAGVASGVAKYFDVDTTLVRVLWASAVVFGGFGLVAYVLLWLILDDEPASDTDERLAADDRESLEVSVDTEEMQEPGDEVAASNDEIPHA